MVQDLSSLGIRLVVLLDLTFSIEVGVDRSARSPVVRIERSFPDEEPKIQGHGLVTITTLVRNRDVSLRATVRNISIVRRLDGIIGRIKKVKLCR